MIQLKEPNISIQHTTHNTASKPLLHLVEDILYRLPGKKIRQKPAFVADHRSLLASLSDSRRVRMSPALSVKLL